MKYMIFIIGIIIVIGVAVFVFIMFRNDIESAKFVDVTIRGETIRAEVRDTIAGRAQGLSGRESLPENEGMLFIFPVPGSHGFWMKDMKFSIDIIWIRDKKVIGISPHLPLPQGIVPPMYYPPSAIDSVLEVNAGVAEKLGIREGDVLQY